MLKFKNFDEFAMHYANEFKNIEVQNRNVANEDYKKQLIEITQQFYSMPMENIFSSNKTLQQHNFWIVSEILSEFFAMNPPLMHKYKPELVEWSYSLRPDKSAEYAYGRRWNEWNQILNTVETLSKRKDSKRAVMPIFMPYDTEPNRKDVPCTLGYDLKIRNNKIDITTFFRSHDMFKGAKYDNFLSSFMAQIIAMMINAKTNDDIQPGLLHNYEGSLHVYGKDVQNLEDMLNNNVIENKTFNIMHKYNSIDDIYNDLLQVLKVEELTYWNNFDIAKQKYDKIENKSFKDFAAVYYNRNAKYNNNSTKIQYEGCFK